MNRKIRKSGQSIVELGAGLLILIPIFLALFDLAVVIIGVSMNDSVCRDAARAAAGGRPCPFQPAVGAVKPETASARMNSVVARANGTLNSSGYVQRIAVDPALSGPIPSTSTAPLGLPAAAGSVTGPDPTFGGQYNGTYMVTTEVDIKLPAPVPLIDLGNSTPIKMKAQQVFPITFIEPNSSSPN